MDIDAFARRMVILAGALLLVLAGFAVNRWVGVVAFGLWILWAWASFLPLDLAHAFWSARRQEPDEGESRRPG